MTRTVVRARLGGGGESNVIGPDEIDELREPTKRLAAWRRLITDTVESVTVAPAMTADGRPSRLWDLRRIDIRLRGQHPQEALAGETPASSRKPSSAQTTAGAWKGSRPPAKARSWITPGPAVSWHSSMVAALLADQKTAEPGVELLRSSAARAWRGGFTLLGPPEIALGWPRRLGCPA
jgi:hypothetical protein